MEEDLARGILESIDMDSYRVEKKKTVALALADEDAEIARRIRDEIAPKVSDDPDYRNARENTPQNACQGWSPDPDQAR